MDPSGKRKKEPTITLAGGYEGEAVVGLRKQPGKSEATQEAKENGLGVAGVSAQPRQLS